MKNKSIQNLVDTGILEGKRTFTTNKQYSRFLRPRKNEYGLKPTGLWYAMGSSWIDWCLGEEFGGVGKYVYALELHSKANVKFLSTPDEVFEFSEKYRRVDSFYTGMSSHHVDWKKVMWDYDGVEVDPYLHELRFSHNLIWYYGWDVPSGCIWRASAKKKITLIAKYNDRQKEFVIL